MTNSGVIEQGGSRAVRRPPRSKNGCLVCRRRKVRCDEQRPVCSHCERLSLECRWHPIVGPSSQGSLPDQIISPIATPNDQLRHFTGSVGREDSDTTNQTLQFRGAVDQLFDYASFMWDGGEAWNAISPEDVNFHSAYNHDWTLTQSNSIGQQNMIKTAEITPQSFNTNTRSNQRLENSVRYPSRPSDPPSQPTFPVASAQDHDLIEYFVHTVVPPILAEVETQKRWSSMRQMLISMANASNMVRHAILAFSTLLLHRQQASWLPGPQHYYQNTMSELASMGDLSSVKSHTTLREHLLATLFFVSYVDILDDRVEKANINLERAYNIFRQGDKNDFRPVEIRLLSWIRLLDARAVSAGGKGLFLSDNDETLLVQPSPASVDNVERPDGAINGADNAPHGDIEDVLFQVLYHPGIVFFRKVQSFMGRISKIDPWHRSRGTVEDETEVMNIALRISKDLRTLYDNRPPLMDHAVTGALTAPHISHNLAFAITRAFRTYLSNYHASKIHLHRVAYKHLPLTNEATEALNQIRRLARLMVEEQPDPLLNNHQNSEDSGGPTPLPVNMLWPLLMLGSEEEDLTEREWIKTQILGMEKVATNAKITALVLEEVQRRQDASKARVDIRSIMHAIFDSCFAIV